MATQLTPEAPAARPKIFEQRCRQITALVEELRMLPTSMVVPMQVLRLQREKTGSLAEYAAAVSQDAALAARILGMVNSAAFAPVQPITRLTQAVPLIGLKNLVPLVFSICLGGIFNKLSMPTEERAASFRSALLRAFVAAEVAKVVGAEEKAEDAFLLALMLDVGLAILHSAERSAWPNLLNVIDLQDAAARRDREEQIYGTDHAAVGELVVRRMNLPKQFSDAVRRHHEGATALGKVLDAPLAQAVDVAASVPHRFASPQQALQLATMRLRSLPNLADAAAAAGVLRRAVTSYSAAQRVLGNDDDTGVSFKEFLQEISAVVAGSVAGAVEEAQSTIKGLRTQQIGLVQQVEGLRQQVQQSELDGLTGVFTRAAFMKRLSSLLAGAARQNFSCAIGYVDVDNFKTINDSHGHATGDAALQRVATCLSEVVQRRGYAGRAGGDEFVFVLLSRQPFTKEDVDAQFGAHLSNLSLPVGDGRVEFTASVGLLDVGTPGDATTPEELFKWADELMYSVKKSGKGRCLFGSRAARGGSEIKR